MLAYYPDRSSPLLVKNGSRGVTGAAVLLPHEPHYHTDIDGKVERMNRAVVIYAYDCRWALGIVGGSVA